jgi:LemA protein
MSRNVIILAALVGFFLIFGLWGCSSYNGMVDKQLAVDQKWADVQSAYQRRLDLIPNLVSSVKGAANFEKETLTQVIEARSKATSISVDPTKLTPESIAQFQAAQGQLGQSLGRLLATVEAYPELKANQNFLELQAQLEGTENRITVERQKFNTVTQEYNSTIRTFPNNLTAGMFGFKAKGYFQAEAGANKAPKVEF